LDNEITDYTNPSLKGWSFYKKMHKKVAATNAKEIETPYYLRN